MWKKVSKTRYDQDLMIQWNTITSCLLVFSMSFVAGLIWLIVFGDEQLRMNETKSTKSPFIPILTATISIITALTLLIIKFRQISKVVRPGITIINERLRTFRANLDS